MKFKNDLALFRNGTKYSVIIAPPPMSAQTIFFSYLHEVLTSHVLYYAI